MYKENVFFLKGRWSDPRWVSWAPVTKWPGQIIEDLQLNYDLKTMSSLTQGEMIITISSIISSLALNQHLEKLPGIPGKSFPGIIINVKMFINHGLILWSSSCLQAAVWDLAFSLAWTEQVAHIGPAEIVQELVQEVQWVKCRYQSGPTCVLSHFFLWIIFNWLFCGVLCCECSFCYYGILYDCDDYLKCLKVTAEM